MVRRVVLVRHGRSAWVHRGGWVTAQGVLRLFAAYDSAGIIGEDSPPADVIDAATRAGLIVTSDLPRAIESAQRLAPGRALVQSRLFREAPLPIPTWWPLPLPLLAWALLMHAQWRAEVLFGVDATPADRARADAASDWLVEASREHATALIVTHGVFRRLLSIRLLARGWRAERRQRGWRHWSAWSFVAPPELS